MFNFDEILPHKFLIHKIFYLTICLIASFDDSLFLKKVIICDINTVFMQQIFLFNK